ncbi:MAG: DNA repair protein RadA [Phycisphaeraceae bacterium]|nr:MAG: DNA repair protein RadA [Phycisphaeraceae bacterium]
MAKSREVYVCTSCGAAHPRWMGKCSDCGAWDSLEKRARDAASEKDPQRGLVEAWSTVGAEHVADSPVSGDRGAGAVPIAEAGRGAETVRISSGIGELDRVLGGGLVEGSVVLLGGEPGIGKSTLLLQGAASWASHGARVLYVSSEESAEQVRSRAERLGAADEKELFVLADTNLARIVEQARRIVPGVMVIDSAQMIYKSDIPAGPGSVTQLRRCVADLVYLAKASGIAVVLVGHVTKEGTLAGPRIVEHLVDVVLNFEGDRYHAHRIVRAVKNRYGTTMELGIFEMTGTGLREAPEGAGVAAVQGNEGSGPRPGSVVCPIVQGSRCVLVEVQALTATGFLGAAKRKSSGLDSNRLAMLIAVLEQHAGMRLADMDVFASSVGGLRVVEPASDLALLLAIAGAHRRRSTPPRTAAVGEVGLGGEIRPVTQIEQRVRESARLGYTRILVPEPNRAQATAAGIDAIGVRNIDQAIEILGS